MTTTEEAICVKKCPCQVCNHRYEACHDHCEEYKEWKAERRIVSHRKWQDDQRNRISDTKRKWILQKAKR